MSPTVSGFATCTASACCAGVFPTEDIVALRAYVRIDTYRALKGELLYCDPVADAYHLQKRTHVLRRLRQTATRPGFDSVNHRRSSAPRPLNSNSFLEESSGCGQTRLLESPVLLCAVRERRFHRDAENALLRAMSVGAGRKDTPVAGVPPER
jgi:hypothetical protein